MLGFVLGFVSTTALLRMNRDQARRGAVKAVVGARRVFESVQQQAQRVAGGIMEDVQDILAEAKQQREAEKAAANGHDHHGHGHDHDHAHTHEVIPGANQAKA